ncbi:hypothetical protein RDI58_029095 [Solanum bulbocastanum]|uniref:Uncharacterized protein n=1 Tax=Solanum bulbocastanum TaxID=147425 RepID=A0AAN8SXF6_SOLBU
MRKFNVRMITKANLVTYCGPTMVANTLHVAAILLKQGGEWDWFINLSASNYPLVTQDESNIEETEQELNGKDELIADKENIIK